MFSFTCIKKSFIFTRFLQIVTFKICKLMGERRLRSSAYWSLSNLLQAQCIMETTHNTFPNAPLREEGKGDTEHSVEEQGIMSE